MKSNKSISRKKFFAGYQLLKPNTNTMLFDEKNNYNISIIRTTLNLSVLEQLLLRFILRLGKFTTKKIPELPADFPCEAASPDELLQKYENLEDMDNNLVFGEVNMQDLKTITKLHYCLRHWFYEPWPVHGIYSMSITCMVRLEIQSGQQNCLSCYESKKLQNIL